eukprot:SAG22_NODE_1669_length_3849_cov_3.221333_4_plen_117_part_00
MARPTSTIDLRSKFSCMHSVRMHAQARAVRRVHAMHARAGGVQILEHVLNLAVARGGTRVQARHPHHGASASLLRRDPARRRGLCQWVCIYGTAVGIQLYSGSAERRFSLSATASE